jgi:hypothetical protein
MIAAAGSKMSSIKIELFKFAIQLGSEQFSAAGLIYQRIRLQEHKDHLRPSLGVLPRYDRIETCADEPHDGQYKLNASSTD